MRQEAKRRISPQPPAPGWPAELQTKVSEDYAEFYSHGEGSFYVKLGCQPIPYDNCVGVTISCLFSRGLNRVIFGNLRLKLYWPAAAAGQMGIVVVDNSGYISRE